MAVDRNRSAFSLYLRGQRHICVTAPGGSCLVTGRTMKGPVSSDTMANRRPNPAHVQPPRRTKPESPQGTHSSSLREVFPERVNPLSPRRLNMTWTGITKERTYVQQTGHYVPNFPFRARMRCWSGGPCAGGMAWHCWTGSSLVPGSSWLCQLTTVKLPKALEGRRAVLLSKGTAFFLRRLFTALQCKVNKRKMKIGEVSPDSSAYQSYEQ